MKIYLGELGNVDFDGPIKMSDQQLSDFVVHLKNELGIEYLEEESNDELRTDRLGSRLFMKHWKGPELELVVSDLSTEELQEKLGRTWMSVNIRRGIMLVGFHIYLEEHGHQKPSKETIKAFVKEYMEKMRERRSGKATLLQCRDCGTYHDPRHKDWGFCEICAGKLREKRVPKEERSEIYRSQGYSRNKYPEAIKELLKNYPPIK